MEETISRKIIIKLSNFSVGVLWGQAQMENDKIKWQEKYIKETAIDFANFQEGQIEAADGEFPLVIYTLSM